MSHTLQLLSTDNNEYKDDTVMVHMPKERNLEPDPPDVTVWRDEGRMVSVEDERGKSQGTQDHVS